MSTVSVEIPEAQEHLKELVRLATHGTEVVLTEGRMPLARLVPIAAAEAVRIAGLHPGMASTTPDFDDPLPHDLW
jgi:prevent-host-death family protein